MQAKLSWCSGTCCVVILLLTASFAGAAKVEDFVPQESLLYLKLQDIDEVYNEIETSENWEKAIALLTNTPAWQEAQQGFSIVQGMLGTDLLGVLETVGYQTGLTIWSGTGSTLHIGLVVHSGGNLGEIQRFTKIVEGILGMSETNTLRVAAGEYRRTRYNTMKINREVVAKYGFVDEFLVLGVGEGAFEKLVDTFRKKAPAVEKNMYYAEISEKLGSGQASLFCNVQQTLKVFPKSEDEESGGFAELRAVLDRLKPLEVMLAELNLLEAGTFLTLHGQLTQKAIEQFNENVGMSDSLTKSAHPLETVKAVSGSEDMFIAVSPLVSEALWQLFNTFIAEEADDDAYAVISFFEGLLNLNLEEDIIPSLIGEIALSVHDLAQFDPSVLESLEVEFDGALSLDAGGIETQGILIFNASYPLKWNQLGNSVSNLQNLTVSQTDYNGVTVSTYATGIHYSKVDGLFLFGTSEEQMYALIDKVKDSKLPAYLKQVPKTPLAIGHLNLARALELRKGAPPSDKVIVNSDKIAPMLTWVSVKEDEVLLEGTLSQEETGLEILAKLVPFLVWNMEQQ